MSDTPRPAQGAIDGIAWELRPEWLAGRYWWRIYVARHVKLLVRYRDHAVRVAEALAADEAEFRREAGSV